MHISARSQWPSSAVEWKNLYMSYGRFLEHKICNPVAYLADRLKKLRGCGQSYLVIVKIVLNIVHFFLGNIYSRGLKFLQVFHENFDCDLTHGFFNS